MVYAVGFIVCASVALVFALVAFRLAWAVFPWLLVGIGALIAVAFQRQGLPWVVTAGALVAGVGIVWAARRLEPRRAARSAGKGPGQAEGRRGQS